MKLPNLLSHDTLAEVVYYNNILIIYNIIICNIYMQMQTNKQKKQLTFNESLVL